jgi:hypothetical protein
MNIAPSSFLLIARITIGLALAGMPAFAAAQSIIGFEVSETYAAGQSVIGQPSSGSRTWTVGTGTGIRNVVTSVNGLTAPRGSQFLHVSQTEAGNDFTTNFKFTDTPFTGDFTASALLAYSGSFDNAFIVFSTASADWRGVQVGFLRDGSTIRFAYRNDSTWTPIADAPLPAENTFYRFTVNVQASLSTSVYSLVISDLAGNELASISNALVRDNIKSFDLVSLRTFKASVTNGNGLYVDDIRVGVSAIPEPATAAVLGGALSLGLATVARRRR